MKTRPSKLKPFLAAMKKVLEDDRTVILTDAELLTAVNHRLHKKNRVGVSTFEFWKSNNLNAKSPENQVNADATLIEDFRETLAYARVHQKLGLTGNLMDTTNRNAFGSKTLLEWKFKDLKPDNVVQIGMGNIILKIENADTKLLDSIDVDFEEQPQGLIDK